MNDAEMIRFQFETNEIDHVSVTSSPAKEPL